MKKLVVEEWVKALRSGEYAQCREYERYVPDGQRVQHDVLGVLGELCQDETDKEIFQPMMNQEPGGVGYFIVDWATMMEWGKLAKGARGGTGKDGEIIDAAILMNDQGKTFDQIANFVEMAYANF